MRRLVYEHASASCITLVLAHVIIVPSFAYHAGFEAAFLLFAHGSMYGAFMAR